MKEVKLELPWPPSVNHYKIVGKIGITKKGKIYQKRINSPKTNLFYLEVWEMIKSRMSREGFNSFDSETISLQVYIDLYPPDNRRRDIDNSIKVLLDSLVRGGLIQDDSQISRLNVQRMGIIPDGKVLVKVSEIDNE